MTPVDDRAFDGRDGSEIALALANSSDHAVVFVADAQAMTVADPSILCLDLLALGETVRTIPGELWSIENNISIANMDFAEFTEAADRDGVFRGF